MSSGEDQCFILQKSKYEDGKNSTVKIVLAQGYGGVPEILLINVVCFMIIVIIFSFLRRYAANYGRLALLKKNGVWANDKISSYDIIYNLLYGPTQSRLEPRKSVVNRENSIDVATYEEVQDGETARGKGEAARAPKSDKGICGWLRSLMSLRDEHILARCGADAVQYAIFQRVLLKYMLAITILSIGVVLPVNYTASAEKARTFGPFGRTTIQNVEPDSDVMWLHCIFSVFYVLLALYFAREFTRKLASLREKTVSLVSITNTTVLQGRTPSGSEIRSLWNQTHKTTVLITGIPDDVAGDVEALRAYFERAYPDHSVADVQFAHDVGNLSKYNYKWRKAEFALRALKASGQDVPVVDPRCCSRVRGCCCSTKAEMHRLPADQYYEQQIEHWKERCQEARENSETDALPIAFVTFASRGQAQRVCEDFARFSCLPFLRDRSRVPETSTGVRLRPRNWRVDMAPEPDDIYWVNLRIPYRWLRTVAFNLGLFILLFFLTTPSVALLLNESIIKAVDQNATIIGEHGETAETKHVPNTFIQQTAPTLLLVTFACLLPLAIYSGEYHFRLHWTRTAENLAVMRKTFTLLLFMVLILPSLGLTSAYALSEYLFHPTNGTNGLTDRYECIFLPDNGAFFVNYVTTTALIACGMELLRVGQLIYYMAIVACATSKYEISFAKLASLYDFPYGTNYAWMMTIFSIVVVYSITCPMITPFGLLYFCVKHVVDRYNIYFAYASIRISKSVHRSALGMLFAACVLGQVVLFCFMYARADTKLHYKLQFMLVSIAVTLTLFAVHLCLGWFGVLTDNVFDESEEPPSESNSPTKTAVSPINEPTEDQTVSEHRRRLRSKASGMFDSLRRYSVDVDREELVENDVLGDATSSYGSLAEGD